MVVDAALAHMLERKLDCLEEAGGAGSDARAPEEFQHGALRKLGRAAQAPVRRVEGIAKMKGGAVELGQPDGHLAFRPRLLGQPRQQRLAVLLDLFGLLAEQPRHLAQDIHEGRPAVARILREIGAAPHRLALGGEKHGQRPAALLAQQMQRVHVDLVDVRPLLAVDFDIDEQLVHHRRRRLVLEGLVRHHVAPVAGGIADRQQDRLVGVFRLRQRLRPPLPPGNRIVRVLQQIGRGRLRQAVFVRVVLR